MEPSPGNPAPARPRYRVRTLLIATTLASVVLACLAPWLRELSPSGWKMLAFRAGLLAFGALWFVVVAQLRYHFHSYFNQTRPTSEAIASRCGRVRADPVLGIGLLLLMLPGLAMMEALFPVWRFSTSPGAPSSGNWLIGTLVVSQYFIAGTFLGFVCFRSLTRFTDVMLTEDRFISRSFTTRWKPGMRFRWLDRAAGRMLLIVPLIGHFELSIAEEQIEAAEQLLTKNLPPWH